VTMVSMPVPVPRIGTTMFGIRIGTLVPVSLVRILRNNALIISQGFYGATLEIWSACLSCLGEYIERSVKVGVASAKEQDSIQERTNKGTHQGVKAVQSKIRVLAQEGTVFYLKMDFSKYFHSINTDILFKEIEKKISDRRVLKLLRGFAGDDNAGIQIGNLLSQLFANIYGHIFDRFIKTRLKATYYFRYMDDTVILSNNSAELKKFQRVLALFSQIYMKLRFSKWHISSIVRPLNFLGYRISENYKLIRKDSVVRAKRKIKKYTRNNDLPRLELFLASWGGHIKSADSFNLVKFINKEEQLCKMKLQLNR